MTDRTTTGAARASLGFLLVQASVLLATVAFPSVAAAATHDLNVHFVTPATTLVEGTTYTDTVAYANDGTADETGVVVRLRLSPEVSHLTSVPSGCVTGDGASFASDDAAFQVDDFILESQVVTCTIGPLGAGTGGTIAFPMRADSLTTYLSASGVPRVVDMTSADVPTPSAAGAATARLKVTMPTVEVASHVSLVQSPVNGVVGPGGTIHYHVTMHDDDATLGLVDPTIAVTATPAGSLAAISPPPGTRCDRWANASPFGASATLRCYLVDGSLTPGSSVTLDVDLTAPSAIVQLPSIFVEGHPAGQVETPSGSGYVVNANYWITDGSINNLHLLSGADIEAHVGDVAHVAGVVTNGSTSGPAQNTTIHAYYDPATFAFVPESVPAGTTCTQPYGAMGVLDCVLSGSIPPGGRREFSIPLRALVVADAGVFGIYVQVTSDGYNQQALATSGYIPSIGYGYAITPALPPAPPVAPVVPAAPVLVARDTTPPVLGMIRVAGTQTATSLARLVVTGSFTVDQAGTLVIATLQTTTAALGTGHGRSKVVVLGSSHYTTLSPGPLKVSVRLSRAGRAAIARTAHPKVGGLLVLRAVDPSGNVTTVTRPVKLGLPARPRHH